MARDGMPGRRAAGRRAPWPQLGGVLLALALPLGAVALPPAPPLPPLPPLPAAPREVSDAWISTRLRAALVPLQRRGAAQVEVNTLDGRVVLDGRVDNALTLEQVTALAGGLRGVVEVDAGALQVGLVPGAP
ncbi:BON domain-containing protein [Stenotrophomonas mori]|uniref:BON domain-containing protein n=1 Tax=Stenotrophomonas mori TaxID=2871096 RepID=A0ABT0SI89_9GAMM|nr:BON domain-containing protein [Stenotrophomonas mori]MCL7715035.1 BON domain-containing protein [Stenotrophomonas mori]